jgi:ABC-type transporter Mla maintaining outer membrane lipid asymmetry permease subunit MlaE
MSELASPAQSAWQSFYVIVGSSGAALIGIQFVVIALIANMRQRPTTESISAFGTPTVVHLVSALLVSVPLQTELEFSFV